MMDVNPVDKIPDRPVNRQTVAVQTDKGPRDIEVVVSGIVAAVTQSAKPVVHGAVFDKKV